VWRHRGALRRKGNTGWLSVASGAAKRWGRSYKAENYYEVLSDSLLEAVFKLLKSDKLHDALAASAATAAH